MPEKFCPGITILLLFFKTAEIPGHKTQRYNESRDTD